MAEIVFLDDFILIQYDLIKVRKVNKSSYSYGYFKRTEERQGTGLTLVYDFGDLHEVYDSCLECIARRITI